MPEDITVQVARQEERYTKLEESHMRMWQELKDLRTDLNKSFDSLSSDIRVFSGMMGSQSQLQKQMNDLQLAVERAHEDSNKNHAKNSDRLDSLEKWQNRVIGALVVAGLVWGFVQLKIQEILFK
jgi:Mg2+ and Co2+ transporter CorA